MQEEEITFENLPTVLTFIIKELKEIKNVIANIQKPQTKRLPIEINDACKIVKKSKSRVYALVSQKSIPHYKCGKKLYFYEDELLEWIENGKGKTLVQTKNEIQSEMMKSIKRKPRTKNCYFSY